LHIGNQLSVAGIPTCRTVEQKKIACALDLPVNKNHLKRKGSWKGYEDMKRDLKNYF
jgi:hypothetical protein